MEQHSFSGLGLLEMLDVSNNSLSILPESPLCDGVAEDCRPLSRLTYLSLSHNQIKDISNICRFAPSKYLKYFDLSFNFISNLTLDSLMCYTQLIKLTLSRNYIEVFGIYKNISIPSLQIILLDNNLLTSSDLRIMFKL